MLENILPIFLILFNLIVVYAQMDKYVEQNRMVKMFYFLNTKTIEICKNITAHQLIKVNSNNFP